MNRFFNRLTILALGFFFILIYSCEDDDICIEEGTPKMTISFQKPLGSDFDSIFVEAKGSPFVYRELFIRKDTIKIPLDIISEQTKFVMFYNLKDSINDSKQDNFTIKYDKDQVYVSKACGFKINYKNLQQVLDKKYKINSITTITNNINDESKVNLSIRFN